ncbi:hypothetical protein BLNAU_3239 [Blattamonas nauphoetae]|uniref:Uncharacterized protein n=1 Tax=Blattamonas nauphoetae TaxID=2049346 RepID=A0ABQ9YDG7_9EUKA|nr:hypothetical protein BLNAU_3239 [Blattamonas nauphoetae]
MQFQRKLDEKRLDLQIEQSITQQFADDSSSAEDQAGNHLLKDDLEDDMNGLDSNGNSENQQNELLKPHTKVHRYKDWIAKPKAAFTDGHPPICHVSTIRAFKHRHAPAGCGTVDKER